jgi:hypothetical protein
MALPPPDAPSATLAPPEPEGKAGSGPARGPAGQQDGPASAGPLQAPWTARPFGKLRDCVGLTDSGHPPRRTVAAPELLGPPVASRALVPRRRDRSRAPWTARLFGKLRDCVGLTGTGPASAGPLQAPWNAESPYLAVRVRAFSPPACNRSVNSVTSRGRDGSGARRPPVPGSDAHVEGERLASRLELTEALHPLPRRPCTRTLHSVVSLRPGERSEICRQQGPSWSPPTPPTTRHA